MLKALIRWVLYALSLMLIAWLIPGISVANFFSAMIACVIIAIINAVLKPILKFITFPINFFTLGLFSLVINALLFMLAGALSPGIQINGFLDALYGSLILSVLSFIINLL